MHGRLRRYEPVAGPVSQVYGEPPIRPLIYGYARVDEENDDEQIRRMQHAFSRLADAEGFCFATTFYDDTPGWHGAFFELVDELTRAGAHHVVVPSLCHLSAHPLLRRQLITRLVLAADAQLWVSGPP